MERGELKKRMRKIIEIDGFAETIKTHHILLEEKKERNKKYNIDQDKPEQEDLFYLWDH